MKVKGYRIKHYLYILFQAIDAIIGKNKTDYFLSSLNENNYPKYEFVKDLPSFEKNQIIDYLIKETKEQHYQAEHHRVSEIKEIISAYSTKELNKKKTLIIRIDLENIAYLEEKFFSSRRASSHSFINDCIEQIIFTYIAHMNEEYYQELLKIYTYLIKTTAEMSEEE